MCKFSIITVCLNAAATIEQTINSVLAQSYPPFEYIVVDGGSTDGTREIIERYRSHFAHVIFEPDDGIYDAFNKGIRLASGDIIGILNADDLYAPWALEKVAEAYRRNPHAGVLYGGIAIVDDAHYQWQKSARNHMLLPLGMIPHPAVFVTRKAYERHGVFDSQFKVIGDWDLLLRFFYEGEIFSPINSLLTAFRNTGISSTQNYDEETIRICKRYHLSMWKIVAIPKLKQWIKNLLIPLLGDGWLRWYKKKRWFERYPEMRPREFNGDFEELWQQIDGEHKSGLEMSGNP